MLDLSDQRDERKERSEVEMRRHAYKIIVFRLGDGRKTKPLYIYLYFNVHLRVCHFDPYRS